MVKGKIYGLGVGPGDPELLTLKAVGILKEADWIAVPLSAEDRASVALNIVKRYLGPGCRIMELDFPMTREPFLLEQAWQKACTRVQKQLDKGETVTFVTLGDPFLYSTYIYLYSRLKDKGYSIVTVPGITSFSAAAAAAGVPLAMGNEKVALLPGEVSEEFLLQELRGHETVVLFKVSPCYDEIVAALEKEGRLKDSVLVIACGFPEESIITDLHSMVGKKLPYFSIIIVGKELVY